MTAYLSCVYADRVEMLVDSAMIDPDDATLKTIAPKAIGAATMPLVLAGRGETQYLALFGTEFVRVTQTAASVDEALARMGAYLAAQAGAGHAFAVPFDLLLAGWSETRGAFHFHACEPKAASVFGCEPWQLRDVPSFWSGGPFTSEEFDDAGFYIENFIDGIAFQGMKLMDAFRKKPVFRDGSETPVFGIGGQLMMVTITPAGASIRSLGYWDDAIGETIDPAAPFYPRHRARGLAALGIVPA